MKLLKKLIIIILLFTLFVIVSAWSYASTMSNNIADNVFRLHVIANSDSEEDQNLKYIVRNNLLEYMNILTKDITSKDAAIQIAYNHQQEFYDIAKNTIESNGYNYDVKVEVNNSFFPTKNYGDISLPAGYYDALKVEIGNSTGQNWWCVMFPPLCFVDMSTGIAPDDSKQYMKENLSNEEYTLISNTNDSNIKLKFKLIELFSKTKLD